MSRDDLKGVVFCALLMVIGALHAQSSPRLRAAEVARAAYAERLSHRNDDGDSDLARYVDNIENYNIGISASRNCYVVVFLLSDPRHEIEGGGAEYWIDKRTMGIVKAMGYK